MQRSGSRRSLRQADRTLRRRCLLETLETRTLMAGDLGSALPYVDVSPAAALEASNQAPSGKLVNRVASLPEDTNTSERVRLADIAVTDDGLGSTSLALSGTDAALLELIGNSVYLKAGTKLDFESDTSMGVFVSIDDPEIGRGAESFLGYNLQITDANENRDPRLHLWNVPMHFVENGAPARLVPGASVRDTDSADFNGGMLTLTIVAGLDAAADRLGIASTGAEAGQISVVGSDVYYEGSQIGSIDAVKNGLGGQPLVVRFDEFATAGAVESLVRHATFQTMGDNPSMAQRSVEFVVTDGDGGSSIPEIKPVEVVAVNDRPSMALGGSRSYRENWSPVQVAAHAPVLDADDAHFNGGFLRVSLSSGGETSDVLSLLGVGGITTVGNVVLFSEVPIGTFAGGSQLEDLVVSFNSEAASAEAVRAVVQAIGFSSTSENPAEGSRILQFTLNDGQADSRIRTREMQVISINDRPLIQHSGGTLGYTRGAAAVALAPNATVSDDQASFQVGKLTINMSDALAGDQVLIQGGFTVEAGTNNVFHGSTGAGVHIGQLNAGGGLGTTPLEVTFNSQATPAVVEQLIRSLQFRSDASSATGIRSLRLQLTDSLQLAGNIVPIRIQVS